MNHIVINNQQRQQYILIFVAAIIFSFGLGYWFGYHTNASEDLSTVLSGIEARHDRISQSEAVTPDWSGESETAPVARPAGDTKSLVKPEVKPEIKPEIKTPVAARPATISPAARPVDKTVATPVTTSVIAKPVPVTSPAPVVTPAQTVINKPVTVAAASTPAATPAPVSSPLPATAAPVSESLTNTSISTEAATTLYAVQAGVFESRDNAMKLVTELNTKGFDAYIDEFVTTSGETKFNVRFGRNNDREQVQKRLTRFKQLYTTTAYIITLDK